MHDQEEKWSARNVNDGRCITKKKTGEQEMSTIILLFVITLLKLKLKNEKVKKNN